VFIRRIRENPWLIVVVRFLLFQVAIRVLCMQHIIHRPWPSYIIDGIGYGIVYLYRRMSPTTNPCTFTLCGGLTIMGLYCSLAGCRRICPLSL
jgi:hypothetical protein